MPLLDTLWRTIVPREEAWLTSAYHNPILATNRRQNWVIIVSTLLANYLTLQNYLLLIYFKITKYIFHITHIPEPRVNHTIFGFLPCFLINESAKSINNVLHFFRAKCLFTCMILSHTLGNHTKTFQNINLDPLLTCNANKRHFLASCCYSRNG